MAIALFLTALLAVVLGAVWSAYKDLKARDQTPTPPAAPSPPTAPAPEGVWPPPPRLGG